VSKYLISFDYGQIEARIIECAARDPVYGKMLWEKYDVHAEWTDKIAAEYPNWVPCKLSEFKSAMALYKSGIKSKDNVFGIYRDKTKNQWTFPLFFGAQLSKVSSELGIPEANLKPLVKEWWTTFAGVHEYHKKVYAEFDEKGYVTYLTGRRAHAPLSRNQQLNYPIQGATADVVLDAMNRLSEMEMNEYQASIQIHDDLTFALEEEDIPDATEYIIKEMVRPTFDFICIPLCVEMSIGKNWCDMESAGEYFSNEILGLPVREEIFK
jgi:DNA polymerase I